MNFVGSVYRCICTIWNPWCFQMSLVIFLNLLNCPQKGKQQVTCKIFYKVKLENKFFEYGVAQASSLYLYSIPQQPLSNLTGLSFFLKKKKDKKMICKLLFFVVTFSFCLKWKQKRHLKIWDIKKKYNIYYHLYLIAQLCLMKDRTIL